MHSSILLVSFVSSVFISLTCFPCRIQGRRCCTCPPAHLGTAEAGTTPPARNRTRNRRHVRGCVYKRIQSQSNIHSTRKDQSATSIVVALLKRLYSSVSLLLLSLLMSWLLRLLSLLLLLLFSHHTRGVLLSIETFHKAGRSRSTSRS